MAQLKFVFQLVLWHAVEGGVAFKVLVAFLLVTVLWLRLGRVVLQLAVWIVWFVIGDLFFSPSLTINPSLCCLDFFFISTFIDHVPEAKARDGVTVASKSLSLSCSGSLGDINAHFDAVVELDLDCVVESDELAEVFDSLFWRQDLDVHSSNCHHVASSALRCRSGEDLGFRGEWQDLKVHPLNCYQVVFLGLSSRVGDVFVFIG